jgi:hypothetical protein
MPMHPCSTQNATSSFADAHFARALLDEQVGDHAEPGTRSQRLEHRGTETERHVVDGADHEPRVVAVDERSVRGIERLRPRVALQPDVAALHDGQLGAHGDGELDDARDVVAVGSPAAFHVS